MVRALSIKLQLVLDNRQEAARQAIMAGLRTYNRGQIGTVDRRPLILTLSEGEMLIGGLAATTFMGWLSVDLLWVDEASRGQGHATALLKEAEQEARRRGATDCVLDTFSFQAPGFYEKRGYREFARLDGFPVGHRRHYMTKSL